MNVNDLPQYKCHKVVRAGRIHSCIAGVLSVQVGNTKAVVEFDVGREWVKKHQPERDGYFVVYEDGYQSYSPAAAFEAGYRPVELEEPLTGDGSASASTGPVVGEVPYLYPCKGGEGIAFVEGALPHQVRVIEEYNQLYKRHIDLTKFFDTDVYRSLSVEERNRLKEQSLFMGEYQRVLLERIRAF